MLFAFSNVCWARTRNAKRLQSIVFRCIGCFKLPLDMTLCSFECAMLWPLSAFMFYSAHFEKPKIMENSYTIEIFGWIFVIIICQHSKYNLISIYSLALYVFKTILDGHKWEFNHTSSYKNITHYMKP